MGFRVEVLDLGINNLGSLCRGLGEAGRFDLGIVASANESQGADLLVLPGVGAYGAAVDELKQRGLDDVVTRHVSNGGYLFGVCLGMQLLGSSSEESLGYSGLGLVQGRVCKLVSTRRARVPHMGWEGVQPTQRPRLFPALSGNSDFYFVHSYALEPEDDADVLVTSPFGDGTFVSGVLKERVLGLQFHPEKSSRAGIDLLAEVVAWAHGKN